MKKFISVLLILVIGVAVIAPTNDAEAQIIYSRKCCDNGGNVRCILENWTPLGNPCFCYGQGWGYTC